jgi:phosphoribosylformylglycinamidine cyclo-ligase
VFDWLQRQGGVDDREMLRTFNCGVGMVVCVAEKDAAQATQLLRDAGEQVWQLGKIEQGDGDPVVEFV